MARGAGGRNGRSGTVLLTLWLDDERNSRLLLLGRVGHGGRLMALGDESSEGERKETTVIDA